MRKFEYIFLTAVLLSAFILRIYNLNWETLGHGEVEVYQSVSEFLKGNFVKNFYIFNETPLGKYIFTLFAYLFSPKEVAMRLVSVIFGSLAVLFVYIFTKKLYEDKWTPLFASVFTAFSMLHIQFSRYVQLEAELSLAYLMFFYAFWIFLHKRTNKNAAFLGITAAVGLLLKTAFINAIITAVLLALIYKMIKFKIKPEFSVSVDNKVLKALIVFIACFFVLWPVALIPLHTDITVTVDNRVNNISADVPTILLVFGYRFTEINKGTNDNTLLSVPLIGYMLFFAVRENILFLALFLLGLLTIYNERNKQDKFFIFIIFVFLITLWLENMRITYRYMAIIVPFLAIVAARAMGPISQHLGRLFRGTSRESLMTILLVAVFVVMLATAVSASPRYALYYNDLQKVFSLPDHEAFQSEGMSEVINYVKQNCTSVFTSNHYRIMMEPYYSNVSSSADFKADCVVKGTDAIERFDYGIYMNKTSCSLQRTITKNSVELLQIYEC